MKRTILILAFILACFAFVEAQPGPVAAPRYMGKRASDPAACSEGSWYYNTASHAFKYCSATNTWSALGGGGGITVGSTTSNGTANTLLKTNATAQVADATGLTQASGKQLVVTSQSATDIPLTVKGAGSQSGNMLEVNSSAGSNGDLAKIAANGDITSRFLYVGSNGSSTSLANIATNTEPTTGFGLYGASQRIMFITNSTGWVGINGATPELQMTSTFPLNWSSGGALAAASDIGLIRAAATVLKTTDGSSGFGYVQQAGIKRVASNVTNATATMSNITDLTINVQAGRKYSGTFAFIANNSTAAEGVQFDFNGGSATVTSIQFMFESTPPGVTLGTVNSAAIGTAITATTVTTTDRAYKVYFDVVVNAGGTLIPRVAEVSHTSGTVTVKAGSTSLLNDLP
jgi:hypothetical protein